MIVAIFFWFVLSLVVAWIGADRKIGGFTSFWVSILLSPLVGFVLVLSSSKIEDDIFKKKLVEGQEKQNELIKNSQNISIADELAKLVDLKEKGVITSEEFEQQKFKLLNK